MANHKDPVPTWLTAEYMEDILRNYFQSPDLKVSSINVSPGSEVGDNYACQIFRIKIEIINKGEESSISIIGKFNPKTKLLESLKSQVDLFEVEAKFFRSLLPVILKRFSKEVSIVPECYHIDNDRQIILMEDLRTKDFFLQPRGNYLNKQQCEATIEALAAFHGATYYALQEDPSLTKIYNNYFWTSSENEPLDKFTNNAQKSIEKYIDDYGLSKSHRNKLLRFREKLEVDWFKVCEPQEGRLNFLLHGDSWMNNMLYHYKDGVADAVKLLDFQIVNYNSFANDLQYFLFSSASTDVIFNELDNLLELYYNKLRKYAPDIPNLTLERVKSEFAERDYFGYIITMCFRPNMVSEVPPDMQEIMEGKLTAMGFNDPRYISDIQKLLPYFEKRGVF